MISIDDIIKANSDLSANQIEGILQLIYSSKQITNADLIRKTRLPKEVLKRLKSFLSPVLVEATSDEILFKEEFIKYLESQELKPYKWTLLEYASPVLESKLKEIRKNYSLNPKREYDQFFATENTSVAKYKVMSDLDEIKGKKIILLGDDDLLSVVLGLSGENYEEVLVLDIDPDILNSIKNISTDYGLRNIRTEFYDARKIPRKDLLNKYDVIVMDPPYTPNGVKLFLKQGLRLLNNATPKTIFLYYGNSFKSPEKFFQIQEILTNYKLLLRNKVENFSSYYGAESIGSSSSLYVLQSFSDSGPSHQEKISDIYTYQRSHLGEFPYVEHYVFKLYGVPKTLLNSKSQLQQALGKFCQLHRLRIMNTQVTRFTGGGYTFNYTLASSNLTVHTWPEMGALHFVLVTCSQIQKSERFYDNLSLLFRTEKVEIEKIA